MVGVFGMCLFVVAEGLLIREKEGAACFKYFFAYLYIFEVCL